MGYRRWRPVEDLPGWFRVTEKDEILEDEDEDDDDGDDGDDDDDVA